MNKTRQRKAPACGQISKSGTVLNEGGFFLSGSVQSGAVKSDTFQVNLIL